MNCTSQYNLKEQDSCQIYIVPESFQNNLNDLSAEQIDNLTKNSELVKLRKEQLKNLMQILGIKDSEQISINIYQYMTQTQTGPHFYNISEFQAILINKIPSVQKLLKNFQLAYDIIQRKINFVILLGGPSGSGKSSIASLLGSKLAMSSTVLSTDSIRHILRNFINKDDEPILFASTYETYKFINDPEMTHKQKVLTGFYIQSELVQKKIEFIIQNYHQEGQSLIIEGVHLTPAFMIKMFKKYKYCIPFTIYMGNENKHKERFAVRSKYMTIEAKFNKYIENFDSIRIIQKKILSKSEQLLIPRVHNTNIDKSIGLIHKTVMRYLRKIHIKILNEENCVNALPVYEEFNKISHNTWSSSVVKNYIQTKLNYQTRNEITLDFINQIPVNDNFLVQDMQQYENDQQIQCLTPSKKQYYEHLNVKQISQDKIASNEDENKKNLIEKHNNISDDDKTKDKIKKNINVLLENETKIPYKDKNQDNDSSQLSNESGAIQRVAIKCKSMESMHNLEIKTVEFDKNVDQSLKKKQISKKKWTPNIEISLQNDSLISFKVRINEIPDILKKNKIISLGVDITQRNIKKLRILLKNFNDLLRKDQSMEKFKLWRTNQRYIILSETIKDFLPKQLRKDEIILQNINKNMHQSEESQGFDEFSEKNEHNSSGSDNNSANEQNSNFYSNKQNRSFDKNEEQEFWKIIQEDEFIDDDIYLDENEEMDENVTQSVGPTTDKVSETSVSSKNSSQ